MPSFGVAITWIIISPFALFTNCVGVLIILHYQPLYHSCDIAFISLFITMTTNALLLLPIPAVIKLGNFYWSKDLCVFYTWLSITLRTSHLLVLLILNVYWMASLRMSTKKSLFRSTTPMKLSVSVTWFVAVIIGLVPASDSVQIFNYYSDNTCKFLPMSVSQGYGILFIILSLLSAVMGIISSLDTFLIFKSMKDVAATKYSADRFHVPTISGSLRPGSLIHAKYNELNVSLELCRLVLWFSIGSSVVNGIPLMASQFVQLIQDYDRETMETTLLWLLLIEALTLPHLMWVLSRRYRHAVVYTWRVFVLRDRSSIEEDTSACTLQNFQMSVKDVTTRPHRNGNITLQVNGHAIGSDIEDVNVNDRRSVPRANGHIQSGHDRGRYHTSHRSGETLADVEDGLTIVTHVTSSGDVVLHENSQKMMKHHQNHNINTQETSFVLETPQKIEIKQTQQLQNEIAKYSSERDSNTSTTPTSASPNKSVLMVSNTKPEDVKKSTSISSRQEWKDQMRKKHLPGVFLDISLNQEQSNQGKSTVLSQKDHVTSEPGKRQYSSADVPDKVHEIISQSNKHQTISSNRTSNDYQTVTESLRNTSGDYNFVNRTLILTDPQTNVNAANIYRNYEDADIGHVLDVSINSDDSQTEIMIQDIPSNDLSAIMENNQYFFHQNLLHPQAVTPDFIQAVNSTSSHSHQLDNNFEIKHKPNNESYNKNLFSKIEMKKNSENISGPRAIPGGNSSFLSPSQPELSDVRVSFGFPFIFRSNYRKFLPYTDLIISNVDDNSDDEGKENREDSNLERMDDSRSKWNNNDTFPTEVMPQQKDSNLSMTMTAANISTTTSPPQREKSAPSPLREESTTSLHKIPASCLPMSLYKKPTTNKFTKTSVHKESASNIPPTVSLHKEPASNIPPTVSLHKESASNIPPTVSLHKEPGLNMFIKASIPPNEHEVVKRKPLQEAAETTDDLASGDYPQDYSQIQTLSGSEMLRLKMKSLRSATAVYSNDDTTSDDGGIDNNGFDDNSEEETSHKSEAIITTGNVNGQDFPDLILGPHGSGHSSSRSSTACFKGDDPADYLLERNYVCDGEESGITSVTYNQSRAGFINFSFKEETGNSTAHDSAAMKNSDKKFIHSLTPNQIQRKENQLTAQPLKQFTQSLEQSGQTSSSEYTSANSSVSGACYFVNSETNSSSEKSLPILYENHKNPQNLSEMSQTESVDFNQIYCQSTTNVSPNRAMKTTVPTVKPPRQRRQSEESLSDRLPSLGDDSRTPRGYKYQINTNNFDSNSENSGFIKVDEDLTHDSQISSLSDTDSSVSTDSVTIEPYDHRRPVWMNDSLLTSKINSQNHLQYKQIPNKFSTDEISTDFSQNKITEPSFDNGEINHSSNNEIEYMNPFPRQYSDSLIHYDFDEDSDQGFENCLTIDYADHSSYLRNRNLCFESIKEESEDCFSDSVSTLEQSDGFLSTLEQSDGFLSTLEQSDGILTSDFKSSPPWKGDSMKSPSELSYSLPQGGNEVTDIQDTDITQNSLSTAGNTNFLFPTSERTSADGSEEIPPACSGNNISGTYLSSSTYPVSPAAIKHQPEPMHRTLNDRDHSVHKTNNTQEVQLSTAVKHGHSTFLQRNQQDNFTTNSGYFSSDLHNHIHKINAQPNENVNTNFQPENKSNNLHNLSRTHLLQPVNVTKGGTIASNNTAVYF